MLIDKKNKIPLVVDLDGTLLKTDSLLESLIILFNHNIKLFSKNPIVSGANSVRREYIAPHPEILKVQDQLEMDYGKLDYCIVNNRVVLLDANKTVGNITAPAAVKNLYPTLYLFQNLTARFFVQKKRKKNFLLNR